ncbi:MAG: TRAP transporter small permease [Gammaproteobacteria bacterium]
MARALRVLAECVAGGLFLLMFGAFLLQIFSRYVLNDPLGWTLELCLAAYVWVVFFGAAFLTGIKDHVSFDLFYIAAPPAARRVLALLGSAALGFAFVAAYPATWDFVSFMKIDKTPVMGVRFDLLYSVYLVFAAAVSLRALASCRRLLGRDWRDEVGDTR